MNALFDIAWVYVAYILALIVIGIGAIRQEMANTTAALMLCVVTLLWVIARKLIFIERGINDRR